MTVFEVSASNIIFVRNEFKLDSLGDLQIYFGVTDYSGGATS